MKTFPLQLKPSAAAGNPSFCAALTFRITLELLTPAFVLGHAAEIARTLPPPNSACERDDDRLRFDADEADGFGWLLDLSTLIFEGGESAPSNMDWRRFLHFLLRQQSLPVAETLGSRLIRESATVSNKRHRITFAWKSDKHETASESVALHVINTTDSTAEIELEYVFEGAELSVLEKLCRTLHALVIDFQSGNHRVNLQFYRGDNQPMKAIEAYLKVLNVVSHGAI